MNDSLADFDNRLMNGMDFCKKAYGLFEEIRKKPDGVQRLRLRRGKLEKKLIEELLPIARYIQARYSHGRQLKVRWTGESQQYDARLLSAGALVDRRFTPKVMYLEVTTAVHDKDRIARDIIDKTGVVYGVKGIKRDPQTGQYISRPYVYSGGEYCGDLADRILRRIDAKSKIKYPAPTTLIIQCFLDTLFFEYDWEHAIQSVKDKAALHRFREIFIFDSNHHYSSTLYGKAKK